jgi:hypothetical protein
LSEEQRRAVEELEGGTAQLVDPTTGVAYALVRADVYARWREAFEDEFDPREAYPLVDRVMAEDDAHDPHLHEYQTPREE